MGVEKEIRAEEGREESGGLRHNGSQIDRINSDGASVRVLPDLTCELVSRIRYERLRRTPKYGPVSRGRGNENE